MRFFAKKKQIVQKENDEITLRDAAHTYQGRHIKIRKMILPSSFSLSPRHTTTHNEFAKRMCE